MEVLVVLGIIGLVLAVAIPSFVAALGYAQKVTTQMELASITAALEMYRGEKQKYPARLEELVAEKLLPAGGVMDSYNRPYVYQCTANGTDYKLHSTGKDGVDGNDDDIAAAR